LLRSPKAGMGRRGARARSALSSIFSLRKLMFSGDGWDENGFRRASQW
jgi:hypothetical protein